MYLPVFAPEGFAQETKDFLNHYGLQKIKPDYVGLYMILSAFQAIPYENVSKLIRYNRIRQTGFEIIRLPDTVWNEYLSDNLGGTCYSLTFFLESILKNCGFYCYPVTADMKRGKNIHCALVVVLENRHWLCDPGYLLMSPMLLNGKMQSVYSTASRGVKLRYNGINYSLTTFNSSNIKWRYTFRDTPCDKKDFLDYWLASFSQPTMNGVCLTRQQKEGMIYVHNNYFREVNRNMIRKNRLGGNWTKKIEKIFGIPENLIEEAYAYSQEEK